MAYRPEGWENPHTIDVGQMRQLGHTAEKLYQATIIEHEHAAFEAGADAMLEGVRKQGEAGMKREFLGYEEYSDGTHTYNVRQFRDISGTWLFIPDEPSA